MMSKFTKFFLFAFLGGLLLAGCSLGRQVPPLPPTATPTETLAAPTPTVLPPSPTPEPSPTAEIPPFELGQVKMLDALHGWGAGSRGVEHVPEVARTSDGGQTWAPANPPEAVRPPNGRVTAFFMDDRHAWVIYVGEPGPELVNATVWRTADGGATWQPATIDSSGLMMDFFYPGQIAFRDAGHGWMLVHLGVGMNHDYVAVLTTQDGGASWEYIVDPTKDNLWMSCQKNGVWFRDELHGYAVGTCDGVMAGLYLYDTADGGETWNEAALPAPDEVPGAYTDEMSMCEGTDLLFTDAQHGSLLVRCTDMNSMQARRWLYRTVDGGQSWSSALLPAPLGEITFLDENQGWYIAPPAPDSTVGTKVYHTTDGGATWAELAAIDWSGPVNFADAQNGWVAGGSQVGKALLHTADGGATWEQVKALITP